MTAPKTVAAKTVVVIGGPTASGKSGLALALAEKLSGTVINADSMQVYDGLPRLTAQPDAADLARAPHRLYAALSPAQVCSATRWRDMALEEINKTDVPIIVGGTGLYLKVLLQGISPIPAVPAAFREKAIALQKELGNPAFHAALAKRDPATAAKLDPLNTQRLVRAWEVLEATGKSLASWQELPREGTPENIRFLMVALLPPRDALYNACNGRFNSMLAAGALEETKAFKEKMPESADIPLRHALGYPELAAHLEGRSTLAEAIEAAQISTRHYAKRQVTWFRHQIPADLILETPDAATILAQL